MRAVAVAVRRAWPAGPRTEGFRWRGPVYQTWRIQERSRRPGAQEQMPGVWSQSCQGAPATVHAAREPAPATLAEQPAGGRSRSLTACLGSARPARPTRLPSAQPGGVPHGLAVRPAHPGLGPAGCHRRRAALAAQAQQCGNASVIGGRGRLAGHESSLAVASVSDGVHVRLARPTLPCSPVIATMPTLKCVQHIRRR